jgi:hypothetical protein
MVDALMQTLGYRRKAKPTTAGSGRYPNSPHPALYLSLLKILSEPEFERCENCY